MSKIISKEQIKEALDKSIDGVSGVPGYLERFAREIEETVIRMAGESFLYEKIISDLRAELAEADKQIAKFQLIDQHPSDPCLSSYAQSLQHRLSSGMRVYARKGVFGNKFSTDKPEKFNATLIFDKGVNDG